MISRLLKIKYFFFPFLILCISEISFSEETTPKSYISGMTVCGKNIPDEVQTQTCSFHGSTISMFAIGENFIGLDEKSLTIKTFSVNGEDKRKNRSQRDNITLGSFPDVSDDGKYINWDLVVKEGFHNTFSKLRLAGSIDVFKSDKLIEKSSTPININSYKSFSVGPVKIKGTEEKKSVKKADLSEKETLIENAVKELEKIGPEASEEQAKQVLKDMGVGEAELAETMGLVMMQMMTSMFGDFGGNSDDEISIVLDNDSPAMERIELYADGVKLESQGTMTMNGVKSLSFENTSAEKVVVKVFYWNDLKKETIRFSF